MPTKIAMFVVTAFASTQATPAYAVDPASAAAVVTTVIAVGKAGLELYDKYKPKPSIRGSFSFHEHQYSFELIESTATRRILTGRATRDRRYFWDGGRVRSFQGARKTGVVEKVTMTRDLAKDSDHSDWEDKLRFKYNVMAELMSQKVDEVEYRYMRNIRLVPLQEEGIWVKNLWNCEVKTEIDTLDPDVVVEDCEQLGMAGMVDISKWKKGTYACRDKYTPAGSGWGGKPAAEKTRYMACLEMAVVGKCTGTPGKTTDPTVHKHVMAAYQICSNGGVRKYSPAEYPQRYGGKPEDEALPAWAPNSIDLKRESR